MVGTAPLGPAARHIGIDSFKFDARVKPLGYLKTTHCKLISVFGLTFIPPNMWRQQHSSGT